MNLDSVKKYIYEQKDIPHVFLYKGTRNQLEEFSGVIKKCFPAIFIIVTEDNVIKSFSYNDFIIKNLKILS